MHKNATKCNETLSKWCENKNGASKIIDTFETYHRSHHRKLETVTLSFLFPTTAATSTSISISSHSYPRPHSSLTLDAHLAVLVNGGLGKVGRDSDMTSPPSTWRPPSSPTQARNLTYLLPACTCRPATVDHPPQGGDRCNTPTFVNVFK
jgi:hypothetical protein